MRDYDSEETLRRIEREHRRAELRRRRRRRERQKKILLLGGGGFCLILLLIVIAVILPGKKDEKEDSAEQTEDIEQAGAVAGGALESRLFPDEIIQTMISEEPAGDESTGEESSEAESMDERSDNGEPSGELPFASGHIMETTETTRGMNGEDVQSTYAILIDLDNNTIAAQKNARDRIVPASMTKILTVLVAAEHITDLEDTFTITREITDYSYRNDCSAAGFDVGETVTVRDLLYGTVLPSGADAAAGLAYYVSGSMEGFVDLMNEKINELGLSDTAHFTNCVGLYDENHYCTVYDMAVMLKAAVENELCREVLSAHIYTTSSTEQHPEGIEMSNWFLRRIEDKETKGEVVCAKTGYVVQSGNCGASYEVTDSGKHYICVTADAHSNWRCIYDHVAIYQQYTE